MDSDQFPIPISKPGCQWANLTAGERRLIVERGAGAHLEGAHLKGAHIEGARLYNCTGVLQIGPGGSRGDMLYVVAHPTGPMFKAGCFWGDQETFVARVKTTHVEGSTYHAYYMAAVELAAIWFVGQL